MLSFCFCYFSLERVCVSVCMLFRFIKLLSLSWDQPTPPLHTHTPLPPRTNTHRQSQHGGNYINTHRDTHLMLKLACVTVIPVSLRSLTADCCRGDVTNTIGVGKTNQPLITLITHRKKYLLLCYCLTSKIN